MKKYLLLVATAVIGFSSCSNEDTIEIPEVKTGAIEFRSITDKTQNRATITDGTNILNFTVTGWWDKDGNKTYGSTDAENVGDYLFNAFDISRGEGATDWNYSPKKYWPAAGKVDFFAYSPAASLNVSKGLSNFGRDVNAGDGKLITYKVPAVSDKNAQEDFLIAFTPDQDQTSNNGIVTLNFQHGLSRILFNAKKIVSGIDYLIEGVELVNLYQEADLDLTGKTGGDPVVYNIPADRGFTYKDGTDGINLVGPGLIYWTNHDATRPDGTKRVKGNQSVDLSKAPVYLTTDYASVIGVSNALMVMPQKTALGASNAIGSGVTSDLIGLPVGTTDRSDPKIDTGHFFIKVSYKAFQGKEDADYLAGSKNSCKDIYIPVEDPFRSGEGVAFEIGRQYTLNLTLGGYEVGGSPKPIEFNVIVSPWSDAGQTPVPAP